MESGFWGTKMTGRWRRFLGMGTDRDMKGSKVTETLKKKEAVIKHNQMCCTRIHSSYLTADRTDQGGLELPLELVHEEGVVPHLMHPP